MINQDGARYVQEALEDDGSAGFPSVRHGFRNNLQSVLHVWISRREVDRPHSLLIGHPSVRSLFLNFSVIAVIVKFFKQTGSFKTNRERSVWARFLLHLLVSSLLRRQEQNFAGLFFFFCFFFLFFFLLWSHAILFLTEINWILICVSAQMMDEIGGVLASLTLLIKGKKKILTAAYFKSQILTS